MPRGPVYEYLAADHRRIEALLAAGAPDGRFGDPEVYARFRGGLLRHIAIEEKILLTAARERRGGEPLPVAARLRLDHGAIAALLVPTPTPAVVATLRAILAAHNPVEEGPGGLYETCEELLGAGAQALVARMRALPEPPLAPLNDGQRAADAIQRALVRAGYEWAGR